MGKKKPVFLWVREDMEEEEESGDEECRPQRAEHRAHIADLKDLANRLAKLSSGQRKSLPLEEEARQQLEVLVQASPGPERRRALMHMKSLLGSADIDKVERFLAGDTPAASQYQAALHWRARLMEGNDETLQGFMQVFPSADRQALRSQLREARKPDATSAQARLLSVLRDAMGVPEGEV
jgi:ribosome-associated protein